MVSRNDNALSCAGAETTSALPPIRSPKEQASQRRAYVVAYHRTGLQTVELKDGDSVVIGRVWPSALVVDDPSLSRQHARFRRTNDEIVLEDLGSRNGTLVGGERIEQAVVRPGQKVMLGELTATVQWVAEPSSYLSGLDEYDHFHDLLAYEMVRSRHLDRPVSLLMLRSAAASDAGHVSRWCGVVRRKLRPIDRITAHDARSLLVLLPETPDQAAQTCAEAILAALDGALCVRAGVATAPAAATTHEALIARVKEALLSSTHTVEAGAPALGSDALVSASAATAELYALVERVARVDVPVLIIGETGSGKEVVARALHERSSRAARPFRALNCGAIPSTLVESVLFGHERGAFTGAQRTQKGIFEQAHDGTVLLDEIGELGLSAQAALLRVLETQTLTRVGGSAEIAVDVRVIAATHRDLERMVREGSFRLDLLFRLNAIVLAVPALRERLDEIDALSRHFVQKANERLGTRIQEIEPRALERLRRHDWPGNVRELRNVIERGCVLAPGSVLRVSDLPDRIREKQQTAEPTQGSDGSASVPAETLPLRDEVRAFEARCILNALERSDWNQSRAAELLEVPLRTLVRRMSMHGIKKRFASEAP
jgi:DNA-binding NtrC family response regulator